MTARFIVADVMDGLAQLEDGSVDLVVTSPPFFLLRDYLPADHPDKDKEIGQEATPADFLDSLLVVTAELRRVLAPHGSICVELGDTNGGSGGAGGDYLDGGMRDGQPAFDGSAKRKRTQPVSMSAVAAEDAAPLDRLRTRRHLPGYVMDKSRMMIPESYRWALGYAVNPFTGDRSPAGDWIVRNIVTWCRSNPATGYIGDRWRFATSDIVVACASPTRYWDDLATRHATGAPLLDYWEIPTTGYPGAHYAVMTKVVADRLVKAMAPPKVCRMCGEPSRRIIDTQRTLDGEPTELGAMYPHGPDGLKRGMSRNPQGVGHRRFATDRFTVGWTDCGHDDWRPALVLDPFAGSGTTLAVATGHGHDAVGIDLDERNRDLAYDRIGGFLWEDVS